MLRQTQTYTHLENIPVKYWTAKPFICASAHFCPCAKVPVAKLDTWKVNACSLLSFLLALLLGMIRSLFSEINCFEIGIRPVKATGSCWAELSAAIEAKNDQCYGKQLSRRHSNSAEHEATTRGWGEAALRSSDLIFRLCICHVTEWPADPSPF